MCYTEGAIHPPNYPRCNDKIVLFEKCVLYYKSMLYPERVRPTIRSTNFRYKMDSPERRYPIGNSYRG
jgi:hypothetical protein